jgi:hypothetical protein
MNFANEGGMRQFSVAPAGSYSCVLADCKKVMRPDFNNPEIQVPHFQWSWETNEVGDDEGQPFRFIKMTKTYFGHDDANLTKLMDSMFGKRLTRDEYAKLTLEQLQQHEWVVTVTMAQTNAGRDVNNITKVARKAAPVATKKPLAKPIQTADIADPFDE